MIKELVEKVLERKIDPVTFKLATEMSSLDIKFNKIGFNTKTKLDETIIITARCVEALERV